MAKLHFTQRPTLWHPKLRPETVADLPLLLPNPVWYALPYILIRQMWFWLALLSGIISLILLKQDGYILPSVIMIFAMFVVIISIAGFKIPILLKNYKDLLSGIEIHEDFLIAPYFLKKNMPWDNVKSYHDLDYQNRNYPYIKFVLNDSSYVREDNFPIFVMFYSEKSLFIGLPLSYNKRHVAAVLIAAAQQLGNSVEYADGLFVSRQNTAG